MKLEWREKKGINQTAYLLIFTHVVIVLDICELSTKSNQTFWMKNCYTRDTLQQTIFKKKNMDGRLSILLVQVRQSLTEKVHVNIKVRLF